MMRAIQATTVILLAAAAQLLVGPAARAVRTEPEAGAEVYAARCSSCHGRTGRGTSQGPSLVGVGAAAADFVLATGRMPAAGTGVQPSSNPHQLDEPDRAAVVEHVASLGGGPSIPVVDLTRASVIDGGVGFRESCAACHQAAGAGATLSGGRSAPSLRAVAPTQIVEAMLIGPGAMPVFSGLGDRQMTDIAAYVRTLDDPSSPGGEPLGFIGPVAEGLTAIGVGLGSLVVLTWWLGRRSEHPIDG